MKTVFAYLIVILLNQFCLTVGVLIGGVIASTLTFWTSGEVGSALRGLVAGASGTLAGIAFTFLVFKWLVGPNSFGLWPFIAALTGLVIPFYNDWMKSLELRANLDGLPPRVKKEASLIATASTYTVYGEVIGITIGWLVFI